MWNVSYTKPETELAWTVLPIPKAAIPVNMQNNTPSHFWPSPFSRAYIGPPSIVPSMVLTRYLTASKASEYLVAIPNTPVSHIHSTAPGPPRPIAVATPTIFPVPTVSYTHLTLPTKRIV